MKVKLDKLTVTEVEAELPERCPECEADLTENDALKEDQFVGSEQQGRLTADGPDCSGYFENATEPTYVVAYRCGNCDHTLVTTEEPPPNS